ncbi:putative glycosyltransferase [Flavihumibacter petaseus NBRC 106054]|uniref:Putative glycosyltransferase n=2 Tax=Flavihumibacter TaxID=1004301 RepID=A0A0E9N3F0_9BACT|nr:putative glycosyltransferase [Flavihumibacter petaseus NBRC 106054]
MRVLFLVPDFPDPPDRIKGGIQSAVLNLLKGFESLPIDVKVVSISRDTDNEYRRQLYSNVEVIYVPEGPAPLSFVNYFLHCSRAVRNIIKEYKPDIIHFEEGMNFLLIRFFAHKRYKHVLTIHGITFAEAKLKKYWKQRMKWYMNGIVERVMLPPHVIHISKYSKNIFSRLIREKAPIIFNAVGNSYFPIPELKATGNRLLYVGVINRRKNLMSLLKVLDRLQQKGCAFTLDIVGDFDESEKYREEVLPFVAARGLSQRVNFLGWKTQEDLIELYTNHDIVVLPSLQETLPVVIAEAMSAARVMVTTDVGGIPEMIDHGKDGFIYQKHQEDQLEGILMELFNNHELVSEVGAAARRSANRKFHCRVIAEKTFNYYQLLHLSESGESESVFNPSV